MVSLSWPGKPYCCFIVRKGCLERKNIMNKWGRVIYCILMSHLYCHLLPAAKFIFVQDSNLLKQWIILNKVMNEKCEWLHRCRCIPPGSASRSKRQLFKRSWESWFIDWERKFGVTKTPLLGIDHKVHLSCSYESN